MIKFIKSFFAKKDQPVVETVPYKIETPSVSPVSEQATQAVVESIVPAKKTPAAKKPRAPKAPK
jgi:hypothetical protein